MLKRIDVAHLKTGMFIQEFCGSWMYHPFWRSNFMLSEAEDLRRIRESALKEVWIDTRRGLDVDAGKEAERAEHVIPSPPPPRKAEVRPASLREEVARAAKICARAKESVTSMFMEARMGNAIEAEQAEPLVHEISNSVQRNPGALISLARLKTADNYTYMHSIAVCALMIALARQMQFDEAQTKNAGLAGLIHDVGKMRIPLEILNKNGKLTDEEFALMKTHPAEGYRILQDSSAVAPEVMDVCLAHHEKLDGTGYPQGLKGEGISLFARMSAICDVYDAITSARPYKSGWDPAESLHKMSEWKGHLDMYLFRAFVKSLGIYPIGSLVRLKSGRLGVVTEQNPASLLTPRVKVFFSTKSQSRLPPEQIDLARPGCPEKIISREEPENWNFQDLDDLWVIPAH
ncbi:MAG: HD-GYP domain-containing protein [Zoogloeaceae bacterium]|jgi:putative nucleotidyltransferase with HDIG domain|nr:HD-GYP domain-containing protein [Zoogloeaceae bacterium]